MPMLQIVLIPNMKTTVLFIIKHRSDFTVLQIIQVSYSRVILYLYYSFKHPQKSFTPQ